MSTPPDTPASTHDDGLLPAPTAPRLVQTAAQKQRRGPKGLAMRLVSKIAGIVFPTNSSGNSMSVR